MRTASRVYAPALSASALRNVEAALARRPRGLLTDIDGTLSAIAPTPDQARLVRGVRPLLRRCLEQFDVVAAISGRPALDARRMIGIPQLTYVGNHGMERLEPLAHAPQLAPDARPYQASIADALHEAREQLGGRYPSVLFENKGATASVHYRLAPDPDAARAAILSALAPLATRLRLRITEGRMVVEVRPPVEVDKGSAVRALVREHQLACVVYLGDDTTDIDAFHALRTLRARGVCAGVAVAVRHAEIPDALLAAADITLASLEEAPRFLRWLLQTVSR